MTSVPVIPPLSHSTAPFAAKRSASFSLLSITALAVYLGILTGVVEGVGLIAFQHINWARWGPMMHVSREIVWISPIVDASLFALIAMFLWLASCLVPRLPLEKTVAFIFAFLAVYDWLTVTGRLYRAACVILALGAAVAFTRWFVRRKQGRTWIKAALVAVLGWAVLFSGIQGQKAWHEHRQLAALPPAPPGSPNVLVIVIDTLRADHVSSYGYSRPTTPNLDRLASEGVLFGNAISPSSWSLPSHASLVTGRYLHDHGVGAVQREPWLGWGSSGLGGFPTIGELLEARGYRTAAFSANRTYFSHDLGFGRGFQHFEDYFNSRSDCFLRTLFGREFARIYLKRTNRSLVKRILRGLGWTSLLDQDAEGSGSYGGAFGIRKHADEVNQETLNWIGRSSNHPFFAFLNYFDVHDPYGGPSFYSRPPWPQNSDIDRYDDGLKYVDDCLGRLLSALGERGLLANTLVIVTSDHGESLGQHFLMTHGRALYWELIHVPLVVWYPSHVPAARVLNIPVSNAAIPSTIVDILGQPQPVFPQPGLDRFWGPLPPNTDTDITPPPISELARNPYAGKHDRNADAQIPTATSGAMQSMVEGKWHIIVHEKQGGQLYDWVHDPGELNNLINTPEGRETAEKLMSELSWQSSSSLTGH